MIVFAALALTIGALLFGGGATAAGPPADLPGVPHYFGPFPNWANSPLAQPAATVTINGNGAGAQATATVGANGAVTDLTITNTGGGYTAATVNISGPGSGATATAFVQRTGAVNGVTLPQGGHGYSTPSVTFSGGGATTQATAHAQGRVDSVSLTQQGSGYTFPTVLFGLPDAGGTQAQGHATCAAPYPDCNLTNPNDTLTVTGVVVDNRGGGYTSAPTVTILDGTVADPVVHPDPALFTEATASATLALGKIVLDTFGAGYASAPTVSISDTTGTGTGAVATATIDPAGGPGPVTQLTLTNGGQGYVTPGIKKFQDTLPGLTEANKNNLGQYMPVAQADTTTFANADYYVIAVVQDREQMSSSLPPTLLREYVQLSTQNVPGKHVALMNDLKNGNSVPALMPDGSQAFGVDDPHYLGPVIAATRDKPVRIVFYNLLPTGSEGDLFLPTDSSLMGSGMGPMNMPDPVDQGTVSDEVRNPACTQYPKDSSQCFKDDRATLHLHGGNTPWISDGTPHQWITPAHESTPWPQGVSVRDVPDMVGAAKPANVPDCSASNDGCQTFYYTNQQSARLMFYHDHAWGITRLNVYAGEAAGYVIGDATEKKLVDDGTIPSDMIPLVIQDRTFVPDAAQLAQQDPTWNSDRWGGKGSLWYHHVYMPAQNPGDASGMSSFGRWMYGPWFWPPATPQHGPIANPYYDPTCNVDDPATWQYQSDPFCEPEQIPGTPNISVGMEQFNDTPIVNGTAYPKTTVQPKSYRLRILNAANDRFMNLQWYVADPTTGTLSEVALKPAEVAAAQEDPNVFPTPDTTVSPQGPPFIQIGTEGGFLPAPVVVPNQPITWITDPTRFDVGNVKDHALLLAPAERADTVVDFSQFAGKTLILYNDAPAAFPARVAGYDYYTGDPDMSPAGAPTTLPGYGPNTRTIMQVTVAADTPAPAFNLAALQTAFSHKADGSGVFESGQHPIIVGQAAYNSAYGTSFATSSYCNAPGSTKTACDGYARISDQGGMTFKFNTLLTGKTSTLGLPIQPKAIHDEMNSANFDEFGRMTANLGVEAVPATPVNQNITLYPYVNPATELIDATGLPVGDTNVTPISTNTDGSQIWKITHNGVDTHPIHFHAFDVQVINRVTWDNIIIPPDPTELGWKDTVRISPLQDTLVALRPVRPSLPWEVPNSVHMLNPMMPQGATSGFNNVDPQGNPTDPITNQLVNFGDEYVFHCHILSHEEMDMMRPVSIVTPPVQATGLATSIVSINPGGLTGTVKLTWNDNTITDTAYVVQRMEGTGPWANIKVIPTPLSVTNTTGPMSYNDPNWQSTVAYQYRVIAQNAVGYGGAFPTMTAQSISNAVAGPIAAPSGLTATPLAGNKMKLAWTDNSANETGFVIQRAVGAGAFAQIGQVGVNVKTFTDPAVSPGVTYSYQVAAFNTSAQSGWSNTATATYPSPPAVPTITSATAARTSATTERITVNWATVPGATGYIVQWSSSNTFATIAGSVTVGNVTTVRPTGLAIQTWYVRMYATNLAGQSPPSTVKTVAPAP
jgi:FtsP/CotA-like multicopper oxidase with cupredoxin domain